LKTLFFFVGVSLLQNGFGQSLHLMTAPAVVRTGAYSNVITNALYFTANQAALRTVKHFGAALYGEKRFLLQELSFYHLAVTQPAGDGAFGLQLAFAGNTDYNASKIGVAYGRKLGERVGAGVQFNYWNQGIRGYGNIAQVTIEGGLMFQFSDVFQAGLQLCNPIGVVFGKNSEKLPAVYTIGAGYQPSQNLNITAELIKTEQLPLAIQAGTAYRFAPKLWAKAGINSRTAAFYVAAGYQLNVFGIEAVGSVHPQLGLSPGLMITYNAMDK